MPSPEEQAFLTAILAAPDDDTPRLVFADWLDERNADDDSARSALIRAQCRLEHIPTATKERRELTARVKALLAEHEKRWVKPLRDSKLFKKWTFRRGFLDEIAMSATKFAGNAKTVFDLAPTVRRARFPDASNEVSKLARCEYLSRLEVVDLSAMCSCGYCPIHNDLRALFNSKHTQSLRKLNIAANRMDAAGAKRLAASKALANVTDLDLSRNPLGADGIEELGRAKHLTRLTSLALDDTGGAVELAKSTNLPALQHLRIANNALGTEAVRALVGWPQFAQLISLDLSGNPIGAAGVEALAAVPDTAKLERLDVRRCRLTDAAVRSLKDRFGKGLKV